MIKMETPTPKPNRRNTVLKAIVLISVASYFAYVLYWFAKTIPWIIQIAIDPANFMPAAGLNPAAAFAVSASYLMEYVGFLGLGVRLVAACFALFAAVLFLRGEPFSSMRLRNAASWALLLEGLYFVSFIPAFYYLAEVSTLPVTSRACLSGQLGVQLGLIAPTLILLSLKLKSTAQVAPAKIKKYAAVAAVSYVVALWVSYWFKWAEMSALEGVGFLFEVPRVVAFMNTAIVFSLAVLFAVLGAKSLLRGGAHAARFWGISTVLLSTHIIVFEIFCLSVNAAFLAVFGEIWLIPLMALGVYLLLWKPKTALSN
jgi:hypothetical protein